MPQHVILKDNSLWARTKLDEFMGFAREFQLPFQGGRQGAFNYLLAHGSVNEAIWRFARRHNKHKRLPHGFRKSKMSGTPSGPSSNNSRPTAGQKRKAPAVKSPPKSAKKQMGGQISDECRVEANKEIVDLFAEMAALYFETGDKFKAIGAKKVAVALAALDYQIKAGDGKKMAKA